ncbi:MAG: ABC transporter ATP-binding protein [Nitrospinae bacterium]|nr:ABC transporter ATP-binding protein [Nitrospinota bacterium]
MDKNSLLEIKSISASYPGGIQVLNGVSIQVFEGEIVSVIGSNGAGKSTTLKSVMGFVNVTEGEILFKGQSLKGLRPEQILSTGLGYVPQGRVVFERMTVKENLELGAFILQDSKKVEESMSNIFSIFPLLEQRQEQFAGTMSGGEQQMLAIARALMTNPNILMLDEPSLGLSPKYVQEVFEKIIELSNQGFTIILVEQNVLQALEVCHRGYLLELGRNKIEGTRTELVSSKEVHTMFIGGSNS